MSDIESTFNTNPTLKFDLKQTFLTQSFMYFIVRNTIPSIIINLLKAAVKVYEIM